MLHLRWCRFFYLIFNIFFLLNKTRKEKWKEEQEEWQRVAEVYFKSSVHYLCTRKNSCNMESFSFIVEFLCKIFSEGGMQVLAYFFGKQMQHFVGLLILYEKIFFIVDSIESQILFPSSKNFSYEFFKIFTMVH